MLYLSPVGRDRLRSEAEKPGEGARVSSSIDATTQVPQPHGFTSTPHGSRPTGTDFSGFRVATSTIVMSLVRPLAT